MELSHLVSIPQVNNVTVRRTPSGRSVTGKLCISSHHLLMYSADLDKEELWVLHRNIDAVDSKSASSGHLVLKCKNFEVINLSFNGNVEDCMKAAESIEQLSNVDSVELTYPFHHRPRLNSVEDGWLAFTQESEFNKFPKHNDWRLSYVNRDFKVCRTYSEAVVVPKSVDDETIATSAKFRQGGRFPVLSYFHQPTGTSIIRSSQPLTGAQVRRSKEDERLLNAYLVHGKKAFVIDTRKNSLAKASLQRGGGYETEAAYPNWKRLVWPIDRWTSLLQSLSTMVEACTDLTMNTEKHLTKLESSHWLDFVRDSLICSCVAAQCVGKEAATVLVHGSEGLDNTLMVTSLAQVILDPDCRTLRGFEALLEKEWVQGGHPFRTRCANSVFSKSPSKQQAPVFLLFLDCVWQIFQQYSCSFEFNESFLIMLFENAYCSSFGTFLCDYPLMRREMKLSKRTVSLWSYVNQPEVLCEYLNPLYEPNPEHVFPSVQPQSLSLWRGVYLRSVYDDSPSKAAWEEISVIKERNKSLQMTTGRLRRQIEALEREVKGAGMHATADLSRVNGSAIGDS